MAENNERKRVLVVMAHPDDGEFGCAATLAKWSAEGRDIYYCLVTDGQVGDAGDETITSDELAAKRRVEAQAAAHAEGVTNDVIFLHYMDSRVEPTLELRRDIARVIRQVRPDVVICQDPTVRWHGQGYINHPDHRAAGEAALDAVYPSARDPLVFPELVAAGFEPHKVREVYIANPAETNCAVDIGATLETQIAALREHRSQVSEERLREFVPLRAAQMGERFGIGHAEVFIRIELS